ncbi:hypothetical protein EQG41_13085 [Billgrantia azerbaijanica]|nr:hypothetical protein EQG41_13085 [Halomonas azerbaijanica]
MPTLHVSARLALLAMLLVLLPTGPAFASEPVPFAARYRLEVRGGPDATIDHRLAREGHHWLSAMRGTAALARGEERSRFVIAGDDVQPLYYASGYSLLGMGQRYRLTPDALRERPDRLTALFTLSRRAAAGACTDTCRLAYQDHRGDEETLEYRILARERLSLPAGDFETVPVEATHPDKPDRRLVLHFHPELPGLLLAADYYRKGERRSRLTLIALDTGPP